MRVRTKTKPPLAGAHPNALTAGRWGPRYARGSDVPLRPLRLKGRVSSNQLRQSGFNLCAARYPGSQSPLNLSRAVNEQQGRQVLDCKPSSEFLPQRAAEVQVEELNFPVPIPFQPMHDGPGRLAAQSEIGVEM